MQYALYAVKPIEAIVYSNKMTINLAFLGDTFCQA